MATENLSNFLRRLTCGMAAEAMAEHSDQQLVERALAERGEVPLHAIVHRHGPMVYRVCWRVLLHQQDTEDAFQATFLILAQKLRALRKHASLASWLHGVAHRVALKAKAQSAARRCHEYRATPTEALPTDDVTWGEFRSALDSELNQLPDKWRLPLILCYLEGRTQEESASHLGWSKSTLRRRLEEARTALGGLLTRRGIAWSAAISAVLFSDCIATAAPAPGLIASTVEAAAGVAAGKTVAKAASATVAALTEGVLKTMFLTKLKMVTVALVVALGFMVGGGILSQHETVAAQQSKPPVESTFKVNVKVPDAVQASGKREPTIQPGDFLLLSVESTNYPSTKVTRYKHFERLVQPDGAISFPSDGSIYVAKMTTDQAGAAIERHLAPKPPSVKVYVAIKGKKQPEKAKKEQNVLTPEEAIKQRSKEKVTVQFKVASVEVTPLGGLKIEGYDEGPLVRLKDGNKFSVLLRGPASYQIRRLGIDPDKHFSGKVVRVTGLVQPDLPDAVGPPLNISVDDLSQLEIVKEVVGSTALDFKNQIALAEKQVDTKRAAVKVAEAQKLKAAAGLASMKAQLVEAQAAESLADKQLNRFAELARVKSIEESLVEEGRLKLNAAKARRVTVEGKIAESESQVLLEQARVELAQSEAEESLLRLKQLKTNTAPLP